MGVPFCGLISPPTALSSSSSTAGRCSPLASSTGNGASLVPGRGRGPGSAHISRRVSLPGEELSIIARHSISSARQRRRRTQRMAVASRSARRGRSPRSSIGVSAGRSEPMCVKFSRRVSVYFVQLCCRDSERYKRSCRRDERGQRPQRPQRAGRPRARPPCARATGRPVRDERSAATPVRTLRSPSR